MRKIKSLRQPEAMVNTKGSGNSPAEKSNRDDALLDNDPKQASEVYQQIASKYPIYITRDYSLAKKWVHINDLFYHRRP